MKKTILAVLAAFTMVASSFALGVGVHASGDFGFGKTSANSTNKVPTVGYSVGAWLEVPLIKLPVLSIGLRPGFDLFENSGYSLLAVTGDRTNMTGFGYQVTASGLDVPVYLSLNAKLFILKVSAGVGGYVSLPSDGKFSITTYTFGNPISPVVKDVEWNNGLMYGYTAYANAGLSLGPVVLLLDVRTFIGATPYELKTAVSNANITSFKRFDVEAGVAVELSL